MKRDPAAATAAPIPCWTLDQQRAEQVRRERHAADTRWAWLRYLRAGLASARAARQRGDTRSWCSAMEAVRDARRCGADFGLLWWQEPFFAGASPVAYRGRATGERARKVYAAAMPLDYSAAS